MKHLKKPHILVMLLTLIITSRTSAQQLAQQLLNFSLKAKQERANEVMQDNEYTYTGSERGIFFFNPLLINGKPLDYSYFNLKSIGHLTVIKKAPLTGETLQVPFNVYLRRNGYKILIPGRERSDQKQIKIELSEILRYAQSGDQLVIEAVREEDGPIKRILKLPGNGC
ncbi:hypothetical protein WSM22_39280 [Cytophagales bacterium WSM2-2]|nr:hypothetical protein WSM22_39280 [Cytophagales bacterium WSM2-2]